MRKNDKNKKQVEVKWIVPQSYDGKLDAQNKAEEAVQIIEYSYEQSSSTYAPWPHDRTITWSQSESPVHIPRVLKNNFLVDRSIA